MTESLKVILAKKAEDLTEDDRKEILAAVEAFKKAVERHAKENDSEMVGHVQLTRMALRSAAQIARSSLDKVNDGV